ncbi:MAG: helix-turn-helix domain-containing protein [Flavisolibacter sp.]
MQQNLATKLIPVASSIQTELVYEESREIPGSVQYSIRRYARPNNWNAEDVALVNYHFEPGPAKRSRLELRFCLIGNIYCRRDQRSCHQCRASDSNLCEEKTNSVDFLHFVFTAPLMEQFVRSRIDQQDLSENILSFKHQHSFSRKFQLCSRTRLALEGLLNHGYGGNLKNIFLNAQTQMLLLYSLDHVQEKQTDLGRNRFLKNEADREKISLAREILLQQIGEPITIRTLSRKVAMNECYLKKGFKEMFGTTIFEFYQSQRMEHAKFLLYEKGLTVTEVSLMLGYSSISHFSTAFKKHTGLKPCELLLRTAERAIG